jgi:hypothetical protein
MLQEPEMNQHQLFAQVMLQRLRHILLSSDFIFTELLNGTALFFWGLWLAIPYWAIFSTTPTFAALRRLPLPEDIQGIIIMIVGLCVILGLLLDVHQIRKASTFTAMVVWAFLSAMFINANWQSTATVIYPLMTLSAIWAYWRITVLHQLNKDIHE